MGSGGPMPPIMAGGGIPPPSMGPPPGAVAAVGALPGSDHPRFPTQRTQVRFINPSGMKVSWFTGCTDGKAGYSENAIEVPGRYNFLQAAIYRLKLSNIPGQPGLEVYPTLEVVPANPRTEAFLAHSSVPVDFSKEDFRQVASGNYLVKVIYLPSPQYQDLAAAAPGEIVSTQLEPGADPITEALRRGDILLVIRMGNMDQEAPNTPAINAPGPHGAAANLPGLPPGMMPGPGMGMMPGMPGPGMGIGPGMAPPGRMVPYTLTGPGGIGGPAGRPAMLPNLGQVPGAPAPGLPTANPSGPGVGHAAPVPPAPGPAVPSPATSSSGVTRLPDPTAVQPAASQVPPPPPEALGPRLP
jgi:hypothetical protein